MRTQDPEEVITMLNEDIRGEHAAIVQYLRHAYAMGEGEMACEIEAIARDEMRHLEWLAETVVELGGDPTLERGEMTIGGASIAEWMERDVGLEQDAIALYEEHIKAIDEPKIERLLRRIVSDEQAHRHDFQHFAEKSAKKAMEPIAPLEAPAEKPPELSRMLNWGIRHEYTVILQYLYHAFMTPYEEVSEQLEDQAINEMQHLGWLAEELTDAGGVPDIEETGVDRSRDTVDMLSADIEVERMVTKEYTKQIKQVDDPDLKRVITRIRDNEIYHDEVFTDLLDEVGD
ncbi:MAG: ferritin-like domain-containing protein [Anaerolineae bacterium]|nr:ferritin-like domain-containing protein [Anaerolineae bacterium]NIQ78168.1 ferritin-like domain-containing protein [Anaerolineae bacterium]